MDFVDCNQMEIVVGEHLEMDLIHSDLGLFDTLALEEGIGQQDLANMFQGLVLERLD